ncbi:MAG: M23 family metallopeptidase [Acidobacteria bacterium]|nr:M23 family metallopeptidase [Acidobacteriota bacterium]
MRRARRVGGALIAVVCTAVPALAAGRPAPVTVTPLERYVAPRRMIVAPGDTVESLCRRLAGDNWLAWRNALLTEMDPKSLRPGMTIDGWHTPDGRLTRVRITIDRRTSVEIELQANRIITRREVAPIGHRIIRVEGTITSSLFGAVEAQGARPELAVRLAEIFQWDIDFFKDLRQGDRFLVIVDEEDVNGSFFRYGTIFAARFVNGKRTLNAVIYPGGDGELGYYDLDGHPLKKEFLRAPLRFSRITSRFSLHRYHPVLHRVMPHYGVDYGAPVGTPVHVTADGVVRSASWRGGAGKMITVRHANGYQTSYLHLSRYARGIHRGVRVHQGQVIGFVGQTGMATGPHLDYRVRYRGHWINPLRIASPPAEPIPASRRKRFLRYAKSIERLLDGKEPAPGATC